MNRKSTTQPLYLKILESVFKLRKYSTTVRTEVVAGFTTFLTMLYIAFVNPQILGVAGMDSDAVFVTTCLSSALGSILMGVCANLPVALAPAMGLNAFFAFVVVKGMGFSWQVGMGAIFWGAIGFFFLSIFRVRYWIITNIPVTLRIGIASGIGLFIGMMGLKKSGVIIPSSGMLVNIGNLRSHSVLLGALGFFIIAILSARKIHAAILVSIISISLLGWILGDVHYNGMVSAPPSISSVLGHVDLIGSFNLGLAGVIFSFMLVNLFDSSCTLIGIRDKVHPTNEQEGKFPGMKPALLIDSISSVVGSLIGASSVTTYIESSSGISVGGRTGLTAVVVGILFFLMIFLSPLVTMVPSYAVSGALIYVGVLMTSSLSHVKWEDLTEAVPAFITAIVMPFSFSITEGIALGFISYCVMKIGSGLFREINLCVISVALLFILKIIFIDTE